MIYVGNQTSWGAKTPLEPFEYAVAHAFDAFEWFPDKKPGAGWDETDLDTQARRQIRETAAARRIRLSVHVRLQANPVSSDGLPLIEKDFELARDLGAALLNIHLFHEQGPEAFTTAIVPLIRQTAETGLQLAIENTPEHSPELFNELFARLQSLAGLPTSHVGMCFDLGHANLCSATLNDFLAFWDRLAPQVPIIHLHLHENWGDSDSHLPLFTGPSSRDDTGIRGLLERLARGRFSGSTILEVWPDPPSLLDNARERLLLLWKSKAGDFGRDAGSTAESRTGILPVSVQLPDSSASDQETPNLPQSDFVSELARGDRRQQSWREKLDFVRALLTRQRPALTTSDLIDIAVYLRFLGTGEVACVEDGRHFRPAHHARIASEIHKRLEALTTAENASIVRQIYPWLPSFAANFRRPEPLTRIRDIAHRNDIPPELKREIKTTLQNKLHRCAGPEDLATSAALLQRISAPGTTYSPEFVEQFKTFHEELKEFFNARSLENRLAGLLPSAERGLTGLIRLFLQQKAGRALTDLVGALRTLTALREALLKQATRKADAERSEVFLADIALEDFAFVLLSDIITGSEKMETAPAAAIQVQVLTLALANLALSGIDLRETSAVLNEVRAWGELAPAVGRDECLRLKATLLRCRRLAETYEAQTITLFSKRAERLGHALGVPEHAIRVFSESHIRGHLVFQVSKVASALLRWLRRRLQLPAWDVLVGGCATGRVKALDTLDDLDRSQSEPMIVLLKTAAGDEEIPQRVAGLVLAQEMPHLSHLGVRARQAGIVFVACEEASEFERLRQLAGQRICLRALPDKITWENARLGSNETGTKSNRSPLRIPEVRFMRDEAAIELDQAAPETSGGKAVGARRLAELSRQAGAGFVTPASLVIPFGVMEAALAAVPRVGEDYRALMQRLEAKAPAELPDAAQRLRELLQQVVVPDAILSRLKHNFAPESRLIVRSSANCEDLEEFAGAGLYESVMNVLQAEVASAVRTVWSSLWTERAALSRREAGIPHAQAHMAVLIQELVEPDFSFVLHTVNPLNQNPRQLYAEMVVGLGDTLASAATSGSPYRLVCDKQSGAVDTLAFANFSQASRPTPAGGLRRDTLDYSVIDLSRRPEALRQLGRRLSTVGAFVERALGKPQDIEGAVVKDGICLVQARPQTGLAASNQSCRSRAP